MPADRLTMQCPFGRGRGVTADRLTFRVQTLTMPSVKQSPTVHDCFRARPGVLTF